MSGFGKRGRRGGGGGIGSSLLLFIVILSSLRNVLLVLSSPVTNESLAESRPLPNAPEQVRKFQCQPRNRSYILTDLMRSIGQLNDSDIIYDPPYIVVERCDSHTGCCAYWNKICTVDEGSTYLEPVKVWILQGNSKVTNRTIQIEHHRHCNCAIEAMPDRRKEMDTLMPNVTFVSTPMT